MKMTKGLLMTALITGSVMWGGANVFAEELQEYTLDQMVVTATRYEKRDVEVAASTEVFDAKKLQETGATNLYDALKFGAGLDVQQYGTGGASMGNMTSKIMMRGNGNGTLVLVNGVPINIRGTYDLNDFPVENIERVEIVRGGGAVHVLRADGADHHDAEGTARAKHLRALRGQNDLPRAGVFRGDGRVHRQGSQGHEHHRG